VTLDSRVLGVAESKRAPEEAPFSFAISLRLEVGFYSEEEVTAEAVKRITTSSTEQAKWWLLVEEVAYTTVETEVVADVKTDADVVIKHIRIPDLLELIGIQRRQKYNVTENGITGSTAQTG
jgi:hypothetical protein